jgi:flavin reductase (DIM6/NTAB) family NADH-FMN oxidoreductase RutF
VSKEPPLVLVCVDRTAVMHQRILSARSFAVSVLAGRQEHLARYFADRLRPVGPAQFDCVQWAPGEVTGAPLLVGALAWLECGLDGAYTAGDHSIFVGSVLSISRAAEQEALLFYSGGFRQLDTAQTAVGSTGGAA